MNYSVLINLLQTRINHYSTEMYTALDGDDPSAALKARAVQKELEYVLIQIRTFRQEKESAVFLPEQYCSTAEVAQILNVSPSQVGRIKSLKPHREQCGKRCFYLRDDVIRERDLRMRKTQRKRKADGT